VPIQICYANTDGSLRTNEPKFWDDFLGCVLGRLLPSTTWDARVIFFFLGSRPGFDLTDLPTYRPGRLCCIKAAFYGGSATVVSEFGVIQGTFRVIQGTFGVIQGTFGVIQGTFTATVNLSETNQPTLID
jgi:hypothetical protein